MKTQYYKISPRNFANEYKIIKITTAEDLEKLENYRLHDAPSGVMVERVTTKEISYLKSAERYRQKYDKSMAGYCDPWTFYSITEVIS